MDNLAWLSVVANFFNIPKLLAVEEDSARKIQGFFHAAKKVRIQKRFLKLVCQMRGYVRSLDQIPNEVLTLICSYLPKKDLSRVQGVCNRFRRIAAHPSLWRELSIYTPQDLNKPQAIERNMMLIRVIARSSQLHTISFKFCASVDEHTTKLISQHANSFYLRELYLDGCERINDLALVKLTAPKNFQQLAVKQLPAHMVKLVGDGDEEGKRRVVAQMLQSGTRGLQVISLAECRNITDAGVQPLAKCSFLEKVCLLGCANVKDEGVIGLVRELHNLREIDLGSSSITNASIQEMV